MNVFNKHKQRQFSVSWNVYKYVGTHLPAAYLDGALCVLHTRKKKTYGQQYSRTELSQFYCRNNCILKYKRIEELFSSLKKRRNTKKLF